MNRSTELSRSKTVKLKDPLVVNFNGRAVELSEQKYQFDLDADGELEWIHFVDGDGALLALDRNGDGVINDGSELFGAISGDGFADLAAYDQDGNGFIDAADEIFGALRLWRKDGAEDRLEALHDRGVGAVYLDSIQTPFELKDDQNQLQGKVRETGIYLTENAEVGTVQQVDMVV